MKMFTLVLLALSLFDYKPSNDKNMGLFSGLFGKKDNQPNNSNGNELTKTAEMLDEDLYWTIVDKSLKQTDNQNDQEQFLIKEIAKLTPKEMIGFRLRTDKLLYDTYNAEMWCAGYIMNGGCSDDGFEYFRNWVISRGKKVYYDAKLNPDNLISEVDKNAEDYEFESFWYVALEAFEQQTGKALYDYIDDDNFHTKEGEYPPIEFNWEEENPESMKKICPKLFDTLWPK